MTEQNRKPDSHQPKLVSDGYSGKEKLYRTVCMLEVLEGGSDKEGAEFVRECTLST